MKPFWKGWLSVFDLCGVMYKPPAISTIEDAINADRNKLAKDMKVLGFRRNEQFTVMTISVQQAQELMAAALWKYTIDAIPHRAFNNNQRR